MAKVPCVLHTRFNRFCGNLPAVAYSWGHLQDEIKFWIEKTLFDQTAPGGPQPIPVVGGIPLGIRGLYMRIVISKLIISPLPDPAGGNVPALQNTADLKYSLELTVYRPEIPATTTDPLRPAVDVCIYSCATENDLPATVTLDLEPDKEKAFWVQIGNRFSTITPTVPQNLIEAGFGDDHFPADTRTPEQRFTDEFSDKFELYYGQAMTNIVVGLTPKIYVKQIAPWLTLRGIFMSDLAAGHIIMTSSLPTVTNDGDPCKPKEETIQKDPSFPALPLDTTDDSFNPVACVYIPQPTMNTYYGPELNKKHEISGSSSGFISFELRDTYAWIEAQPGRQFAENTMGRTPDATLTLPGQVMNVAGVAKVEGSAVGIMRIPKIELWPFGSIGGDVNLGRQNFDNFNGGSWFGGELQLVKPRHGDRKIDVTLNLPQIHINITWRNSVSEPFRNLMGQINDHIEDWFIGKLVSKTSFFKDWEVVGVPRHFIRYDDNDWIVVPMAEGCDDLSMIIGFGPEGIG